MELDFEVFFKANEPRIHFQMVRLGIPESLRGEFYSEGVLALWQGYKRYDSTHGNVGTFLNYQIRYRLIDLIRKKTRDQEVVDEVMQKEKTEKHEGNRHRATGLPVFHVSDIVLENKAFWEVVRKDLTPSQWKWVHYFIIADLTVKEIAEIEGVTAGAVKSWGREVRRKLRNDDVYKKLLKLI